MDWQDIRWSMALESPPVIVQIGGNTHGRESEEAFLLPGLWCFHLYAYEGELEVDGQALPIRPGYVGITPPGANLLYHFSGRSPHYYAHFSVAPSGGTYQVPAMRDLGESFSATVDAFQEAIRFWSISHTRSAVRLWDILWQIADISSAGLAPEPPPALIQRVLTFIDAHLHEPLRVERLAAEQDISHNHLTRLFRAAQGCTPSEYIQNRRVAQARHLLIYSSLPIKAIAASIGIMDMQVFNKFIRHALGTAPRKLREQERPKLGLLK